MNDERGARTLESVSELSAVSRVGQPPAARSPEMTEHGREPAKPAARNAGDGLSRTCFLSGFATRTLRLPTGEMGQLLIAQSVRTILDCLLDGRSSPADGDHALVEYDHLLGLEGGNSANASGLLAKWRMTPDALEEWVEEVYRNHPLVPAMNKERSETHPDETLTRCRKGWRELKTIVDWLREIESGNPSDSNPVGEFIHTLQHQSTNGLRSALDDGKVRGQMELLAWHPSQIRGLDWLDGFVLQSVEYCEAQVKRPSTPNRLDQVLEDLDACGAQMTTVEGQLRRENQSWLGRVRYGWSLARQVKPYHPYQPATVEKVARLPNRLASLRYDVEALVIKTVVQEQKCHFFSQTALALGNYRRTVLQPLALRLNNARDYARRLEQQALADLKCWQGSPTTRQLYDDRLLAAVDRHFGQLYDGPREVIQALLEEGIVLGRERLAVRNMGHFTPERLCAILYSYIERGCREQRRFLDQGWALPDARRLLMANVPWLEGAMQPLINYDRDGLGERNVRGYLLVPDKLALSPPLGERLGNLPVKRSANPQCVTVVSFLHGVSTNALRGLERCFAAYRRRLGDHLDAVDPQRFPLHIFRDGQYYDEPYSPVGWRFTDQGLKDLLVLAHLLGVSQDGVVRLPVRTFAAEIEALKADHNRMIELGRTVLDAVRFAGRHDLVREKLLASPALRPLRQTYWAENGSVPQATATAPGESR